MNQQTLFCGEQEVNSAPNKKSYYWVQAKLVREQGPFYQAKITSSEDVVNLVNGQLDLENCDREHFIAIYMDRKGKVNAISTISIGSASSTIVHPREVFKPAMLASAASVILVHNHPSGEPTPSSEDIDITRRLIEAGNILDIKVLDHVIVGYGNNISLKSKGLM